MTGNEERERILRMVSEKRLTPSEAEELLVALDAPPQQVARPAAGALAPRPAPRTLLIHVADGGESKVNLRIPLGLARAAGGFIPRQAQQHLASHDINLERLLDGLGPAGGVGTLLEVRDGAGIVRIAVEG